MEKETLKKSVIVEEELDCIDRDDIRNLEDSLDLRSSIKKCGNLIVVNDSGELIRNIKDAINPLQLFLEKRQFFSQNNQ